MRSGPCPGCGPELRKTSGSIRNPFRCPSAQCSSACLPRSGRKSTPTFMPPSENTVLATKSRLAHRSCWPRAGSERLTVKIKIVWIGKTKEPAISSLTEEYLKRISRYAQVEGVAVRDEAALLEMSGRTPGARAGAKSTLVLMDSRGKELSSEEFA